MKVVYLPVPHQLQVPGEVKAGGRGGWGVMGRGRQGSIRARCHCYSMHLPHQMLQQAIQVSITVREGEKEVTLMLPKKQTRQ